MARSIMIECVGFQLLVDESDGNAKRNLYVIPFHVSKLSCIAMGYGLLDSGY